MRPVAADKPDPCRCTADVAVVEWEVANLAVCHPVRIFQVVGKAHLGPQSTVAQLVRHVCHEPGHFPNPILELDVRVVPAFIGTQLRKLAAEVQYHFAGLLLGLRGIVPKFVVRRLDDDVRQ